MSRFSERRKAVESSLDHQNHDGKEKKVIGKRAVNQHLTIEGDKEKFKELLRRRLIECGWRDELRVLCRDTIREKGVNNVTVDEIVEEVTPKGRALVPDTVKKELLQKIKTYLHDKAFK
ncbi:Transcription and mRNA export factor ENY2 [Frankliniella fusca]|uniref:Enhancer of yellow 2 transcription factor n=1 Tax=Frankliniella fusca TaxID=407009 RepID=A0AAE1LF45_9NEOP|nr:Transcription and mRNA export factor ENY2 [Frankliniella fusca]